MASPEDALRIGFQALELGASSVYCSASPWMIEAMARERIPVVGHLGMVPRHAIWTNVRAIGKTATEARHLVAMDEAEFKTAVEAIEGCGNA
jgi:3-methyl-2-oxobutanoate hydroxymethyltransferase